jgi:hypothetical protein
MAQSQSKNLLLSKRNPIARTLKTFTQKIVPDKKKYDRKKIKKQFSLSD